MTKKNFKSKNRVEIETYLSRNGLTAQKCDSGLYYLISKEGHGARPRSDSNVCISYMGYFLHGGSFDQNERLEINLKDVIAGWTEGLSYFKEGGEGILFIPAHLAYGSTDYASIPGGSVLIFDIHLMQVSDS